MGLFGLVLEEKPLALEGRKIGYYIGSFDPLHIGHEAVAQNAVESGHCDYVVVYPSWGGDRYKNRIPVEQRLRMIFAVFQDHPKVIVTRLPPAQFQKMLQPSFAKAQWFGIIGSDVALQINADPRMLSRFMRGHEIPEKYAENTLGGTMAVPVSSFLVSLRCGDELGALKGKIGERPFKILSEKTPEDGFSSSAFKRALKDKKGFEKMVSAPVLKIIQELELYR